MASAPRLQALLELSRTLSSSVTLSEVLREFTDRAAELTGATAAEVSVLSRRREALVQLVEYVDGKDRITAEGGELYFLSDYPATRLVLETQQPVQIRVSHPDDDPAERALLEKQGLSSLLMLPLVARGETIGLMEVVDVADRGFDSTETDFCQALCDVLAIAVRNAVLYTRLRQLAACDPLTGLYNHRLFHEKLEAAVPASRQNGESVSLLVLHLDGLKRVNDLQGHRVGDQALRALADAVLSSLGDGDTAYRLGGDEFAVILERSSAEAALETAEQVRRRLSELGPGHGFSGGVVEASSRYSPGDLYRAAHLAAADAKQAGGGRTLLGTA